MHPPSPRRLIPLTPNWIRLRNLTTIKVYFYASFARYSYDYGLVHFIMMSTEHNFEPGSRQYKWLENDLKNVDRKKTPWLVFGGHRPMYDSQFQYGKNIFVIEFPKTFWYSIVLYYGFSVSIDNDEYTLIYTNMSNFKDCMFSYILQNEQLHFFSKN